MRGTGIRRLTYRAALLAGIFSVPPLVFAQAETRVFFVPQDFPQQRHLELTDGSNETEFCQLGLRGLDLARGAVGLPMCDPVPGAFPATVAEEIGDLVVLVLVDDREGVSEELASRLGDTVRQVGNRRVVVPDVKERKAAFPAAKLTKTALAVYVGEALYREDESGVREQDFDWFQRIHRRVELYAETDHELPAVTQAIDPFDPDHQQYDPSIHPAPVSQTSNLEPGRQIERCSDCWHELSRLSGGYGAMSRTRRDYYRDSVDRLTGEAGPTVLALAVISQLIMEKSKKMQQFEREWCRKRKECSSSGCSEGPSLQRHVTLSERPTCSGVPRCEFSPEELQLFDEAASAMESVAAMENADWEGFVAGCRAIVDVLPSLKRKSGLQMDLDPEIACEALRHDRLSAQRDRNWIKELRRAAEGKCAHFQFDDSGR